MCALWSVAVGRWVVRASHDKARSIFGGRRDLVGGTLSTASAFLHSPESPRSSNCLRRSAIRPYVSLILGAVALEHVL